MDKLQWGNRKAPRRVKMKDSSLNAKSSGGIVEKKMTSRVVDDNINSNRHSSKEGRDLPPALSPHLSTRYSDQHWIFLLFLGLFMLRFFIIKFLNLIANVVS